MGKTKSDPQVSSSSGTPPSRLSEPKRQQQRWVDPGTPQTSAIPEKAPQSTTYLIRRLYGEKKEKKRRKNGREEGNTYTHEKPAKAEGSIKAVGRETDHFVTS
ncbi:hypothetical protein LTR10_016960 [Elasticomyces elasticus]|uniref:Uncharacterized protein n=1 Tax=Exophiala sideris TaxID=1016849 RepID=A0ABR0JH07_9EURO|nr:hypothetical protein LTR10_016960 [Elasticomyces elasticus]KAK5025214.1 hypothetical protein LTS07_008065 [Exophiala sideris]KAK5029238.1 hypothetical protein LTR13_008775 [Exophiala sideris]KAK5063273.1 hypothetical protein LTR69_003979 [Exophiala sideris]KAK5178989.1 hypothetical protein LTR44_008478 [Eurotiomycetes sp. CCFEE 6388]